MCGRSCRIAVAGLGVLLGTIGIAAGVYASYCGYQRMDWEAEEGECTVSGPYDCVPKQAYCAPGSDEWHEFSSSIGNSQALNAPVSSTSTLTGQPRRMQDAAAGVRPCGTKYYYDLPNSAVFTKTGETCLALVVGGSAHTVAACNSAAEARIAAPVSCFITKDKECRFSGDSRGDFDKYRSQSFLPAVGGSVGAAVCLILLCCSYCSWQDALREHAGMHTLYLDSSRESTSYRPGGSIPQLASGPDFYKPPVEHVRADTSWWPRFLCCRRTRRYDPNEVGPLEMSSYAPIAPAVMPHRAKYHTVPGRVM